MDRSITDWDSDEEEEEERMMDEGVGEAELVDTLRPRAANGLVDGVETRSALCIKYRIKSIFIIFCRVFSQFEKGVLNGRRDPIAQ